MLATQKTAELVNQRLGESLLPLDYIILQQEGYFGDQVFLQGQTAGFTEKTLTWSGTTLDPTEYKFKIPHKFTIVEVYGYKEASALSGVINYTPLPSTYKTVNYSLIVSQIKIENDKMILKLQSGRRVYYYEVPIGRVTFRFRGNREYILDEL